MYISSYFITQWLITIYSEREKVHKRARSTSHTCLSNKQNATYSWLHSSGTDQLVACIPVLIFLAYLYHSTFYPSTKNKKFSRWTFTSITHVSYNQLDLLCRKRYLHSTSPWKAPVNFVFVVNGLYYIYLCGKLHNALWWKDLFTPHCKNASIAKEEKQSFSRHSEIWLDTVPTEQQGKTYSSDDQRHNILYVGFPQPRGHMSQTRTK